MPSLLAPNVFVECSDGFSSLGDGSRDTKTLPRLNHLDIEDFETFWKPG